ncbi:MAG TPA: hypothetical protein VMF66_18565 [Candidatus Acidoferrum sp.]|nr:hypothetical protein [Candidatus Acidoferrum sp.]
MTRSLPLAFVTAILVTVTCPCSSVFAQSTPAAAASPAALPQDAHGGLTVSVDPYTDSNRAKSKFGKSANPVPAGILPVDVYFKNDTPHPMRVDLETVQLEVQSGEESHQYVDWLTVGQVAYKIRHPGGGPSAPSARRFPVGIPLPSKDKKVDEIIDQLRPFVLDSNIIPPLGTIHGFLFFDVSHDFTAAQKASLYLPDVVLLPDKTALMFFEVPLIKGSATVD